MNNEEPVFPAKLYLFDGEGKYHRHEVASIPDEASLNSPTTQTTIIAHIKSGREVRLTDPMDNLLFHANNGKIIFPT